MLLSFLSLSPSENEDWKREKFIGELKDDYAQCKYFKVFIKELKTHKVHNVG